MRDKKEEISIYDKIKLIAKQEAKKKNEHAKKIAHLFEEDFKKK